MMKRLLPMALALSLAGCEESEADQHHRKAIDLYKAGEWKQAATEYEDVIRLKPDIDERVIKKTSNAWVKAQEYDKAERLLIMLAEKRKTTEEKLLAYREIASMWLQGAHDFDKAEQWFNKALELKPDDESTWGWLAELASVQGGARSMQATPKPDKLDLALERYNKVISINPDNIGPYVNMRIVYAKYIPYLQAQAELAERDAEANKKEKETYEDFKKQAEEFTARALAMRAEYEKVDAKVKEMARAAKLAALADAGIDAGSLQDEADAGVEDGGVEDADGGTATVGADGVDAGQ